MKKKVYKLCSLLIVLVMVFGLVACGNSDKKQKGMVKISFWAEVTRANQDALLEVVQEFNNSHSDVYVTLVPQSTGFGSNLSTTLSGSTPPDVVMVEDKQFKTYVQEGYLEKLDDYIAADTNQNFSLENMWPSAVNRYSYNSETGYSATGEDYYAIPGGINPTII